MSQGRTERFVSVALNQARRSTKDPAHDKSEYFFVKIVMHVDNP